VCQAPVGSYCTKSNGERQIIAHKKRRLLQPALAQLAAEKNLRVGDPVTVFDKRGCVHFTITGGSAAEGFTIGPQNDIITLLNIDNMYGMVHLQDEGVRWTRGHHAEDSREVACLEVAQGLTTK
jgi:hypothetical protein